MLKDLVLKNRSYRGFDESVRISRETLEGFVDCARLCPSSVNKQPLKYFLAWEPEEVEKVQGLTKWARALPDMVLPHPGKRPTGAGAWRLYDREFSGGRGNGGTWTA